MGVVSTAYGPITRGWACAAAIVLEVKMSVHLYLAPRTASSAWVRGHPARPSMYEQPCGNHADTLRAPYIRNRGSRGIDQRRAPRNRSEGNRPTQDSLFLIYGHYSPFLTTPSFPPRLLLSRRPFHHHTTTAQPLFFHHHSPPLVSDFVRLPATLQSLLRTPNPVARPTSQRDHHVSRSVALHLLHRHLASYSRPVPSAPAQ
jgi:hypothetical protein